MNIANILISALPASVTAAATIAYIILVYKQSKATAGMLKAQIVWRLLEEVYKPLLQDLLRLSSISNYGVSVPAFSWAEIKFKYPYLIYLIPKKLREELNSFNEEYRKFSKEYQEVITRLTDALRSKGYDGIPSINVAKCHDLPYKSASLLYFIRNEEALEELRRKCGKDTSIAISMAGVIKVYRSTEEVAKVIEELVKIAKPIHDEIASKLKEITDKAKYLHNELAKEVERKIKEIEEATK